jgi:hypothetical protein
MELAQIKKVPRRVFLDTNVVNVVLDYGEAIHECMEIPEGLDSRLKEDIEALRGIFATGQRAFWQFAISPLTYREIIRTKNCSRRHELANWFFEIWNYWREFLHSADNLPSFSEAEEERLHLISSGILEVLPDMNDRVLLCDAVVYRCDAFCTIDWSTILRYREKLQDLPMRILTPKEWWDMIRIWADILT